MGVVRYKSTGDMLEAADLVLAGSKKQQVDSEPDEDDDETARKRPLLKGAKQQVNSSRWGSCKLLNCHNNNNDFDYDDGRESKQCDIMREISKTRLYDHEEASIELKKWTPIEQDQQVRLANDMLAFGQALKGQAIEEPQNRSCVAQRDQTNEEEQERLLFEPAGLMRPVDWRLCGEDAAPRRSQPMTTTTTSGASRKRRATRMRLASLSLSSPALSLRENPSALPGNSSVSGKAHLLRRLRNNDRRRCRQAPANNARDEDNNDGPALRDAHAGEQQVDKGSPRDCFIVDVGLLERQQQQQHRLAYIDGQKDAAGSPANDNGFGERSAGQSRAVGQPGENSQVSSSRSNRLGSERDTVGHYCKRTTVWPNPDAKQQQEPLSNATATGRAQTDIDIVTVNNKLMLDINSTAPGCLIGSCCNTWRQALHPYNSGSYKVARQQQQQQQQNQQQQMGQLVSGFEGDREMTAIQVQDRSEQEIEGATNNNAYNRLQPPAQQVDNAQRSSSNVAKERRLTARGLRPSRSPISLQRQTNARLTWHRIKIQQQRQEQLAQLALRERQQLEQHSHYNSYQQTRNSSRGHTANNENQIDQQTRGRTRADLPIRPPTPDYESFYLINGLHNRYPRPARTLGGPSSASAANYGNQSSSGHRQEELSQRSGKRELSFIDRFGTRKQQQVIAATPVGGSIEICDNQPACSSRQEQHCQAGGQQPTRSANCKGSSSAARGANVIIYKSINMLTNGSSSTSRQQYHHLGNLRRFDSECEAIDSDDAQTISSSTASTLSLNKPFCKICHVGATKNGDKLISPCKCSGTMQYIHCGCLLKWLEISNRTNEKPMNCELCSHEYTWHKKFNYRHMKLPKCSPKDLILHMIFIVAIGAMLLSAMAPMLYRKPSQDTALSAGSNDASPPANNFRVSLEEPQKNRRASAPYHSHTPFSGASSHLATGRLAHDEKFMLLCAASFFISFFLAIYVQTRARDTLYGLVVKFLSMNQTYYITEYDHGQMNGATNSTNNNSKQQQQQQQPADEGEGTTHMGRKNSD